MKNVRFLSIAVMAAWFSGLHWQYQVALIWCCVMCIDYITGSVAAWKNHEWSSTVAREGLLHKAGMIAAVAVAVLADACIAMAARNVGISAPWNYCVYALVMCWYIFTELGSILENAVKLGAPVPAWLVKMLKSTVSEINKRGGNDE